MLLTPPPLVLDLDGTLIHTDTFHEMMVCLLQTKPWLLLLLPFWFLRGRVYTKTKLVEAVSLNPAELPYNGSVLAYAQNEAKKGRPLILATGTHHKVAQDIANYMGIFDEVIATDEHINMTGPNKQKALLERFGEKGFDYAGDSHLDFHIWKVSRLALVVHPKRGALRTAQTLHDSNTLTLFPRHTSRFQSLFQSLRPFFWVCNLMAPTWLYLIALSFLTSGLLILGDLLTLYLERKGSFKKSVFAEGHLQIITGFLLTPLLTIPPLLLFPRLWLYLPFFIGLDLLTRPRSQVLRWFLLSLLHILYIFFFLI